MEIFGLIKVCTIAGVLMETCTGLHSSTLRTAKVKLEQDTYGHPDYDKYQIPVKNSSQPIEVNSTLLYFVYIIPLEVTK